MEDITSGTICDIKRGKSSKTTKFYDEINEWPLMFIFDRQRFRADVCLKIDFKSLYSLKSGFKNGNVSIK